MFLLFCLSFPDARDCCPLGLIFFQAPAVRIFLHTDTAWNRAPQSNCCSTLSTYPRRVDAADKLMGWNEDSVLVDEWLVFRFGWQRIHVDGRMRRRGCVVEECHTIVPMKKNRDGIYLKSERGRFGLLWKSWSIDHVKHHSQRCRKGTKMPWINYMYQKHVRHIMLVRHIDKQQNDVRFSKHRKYK